MAVVNIVKVEHFIINVFMNTNSCTPPQYMQSSTPPLLDGSPLHNRATLTGTEPLSQSLEGIEIGGNTVEVEILPRLTDGPGNSDGSLQDSPDYPNTCLLYTSDAADE